MRRYRSVTFRDAKLKFSSTHPEVIEREYIAQREKLEAYIRRQPVFASSLIPLALLAGAPPIAVRMAAAAEKTGVGPMAAVAGALAEAAARSAIAAGAAEAVVENGGDMFLYSPETVVVGLWAGSSGPAGKLAFAVPPECMPLALCSSSSTMGHSYSMGGCDLATVVSKNAALADAAATHAGNLVRTEADIEPVLERIAAIPEVLGVFLVKNDRIGMAGELPPLVRADQTAVEVRISRF